MFDKVLKGEQVGIGIVLYEKRDRYFEKARY